MPLGGTSCKYWSYSLSLSLSKMYRYHTHTGLMRILTFL